MKQLMSLTFKYSMSSTSLQLKVSNIHHLGPASGVFLINLLSIILACHQPRVKKWDAFFDKVVLTKLDNHYKVFAFINNLFT